MARMMSGACWRGSLCRCCNDPTRSHSETRALEKRQVRAEIEAELGDVGDDPWLSQAEIEERFRDWGQYPYVTCERCGRNGQLTRDIDLSLVDMQYYCTIGSESCLDLAEMYLEVFPEEVDFSDPMVSVRASGTLRA